MKRQHDMFQALSVILAAQITATPTSLDFWIGEWDLTGKSRTSPGKDEWTQTTAKNSIRKVLGGKVIEESFSMTGFSGKSWSTFNTSTKKWQQTWVDDSGSYLLFEGGEEGGAMVLNQVNGPRNILMRMTWREVTKNSLTWLWQRSSDNGKSWETQWQLDYKRRR